MKRNKMKVFLENLAIFVIAFLAMLVFLYFIMMAIFHRVENNAPEYTEIPSDPPAVSEQVEPEVTEPVRTKTDLGEFRLTAYCSCSICCGKWAENRPVDENGNEIVYGSIGVPLVQGISVAVDPKVIPYGSVVEINGNEYIAEDCGVKGNRIDVYFNDHQSAREFGVQYANVFLICDEGLI